MGCLDGSERCYSHRRVLAEGSNRTGHFLKGRDFPVVDAYGNVPLSFRAGKACLEL